MPTLPTNKRRKYIPEKEPKKAGSNQSFYNSTRWRKNSVAYRKQHPLCEACKEGRNETQPCDVTDHIVAIEQGGARFNPINWMAMCHKCHNSKRGMESHHGILVEWEFDFNNEKVPIDRHQIIRVICQNLK